MNYNSVISRSRDVEHNGTCRHNIDKICCGYCNGSYSVTKRKVKIVSDELLKKYEEIKERCKSFRDIWTEEEINIVYDNFKDITDKKEKRKMAYITAIQLERTINAVVWMFFHIFSKKEDLHRGNAVKQFRETIKA